MAMTMTSTKRKMRRSANEVRPLLLLLLAACLFAFIPPALAATPNVIVSVSDPSDGSTGFEFADGVSTQWMAKRADFGSERKEVSGTIVLPPPQDPYLCDFVNFTLNGGADPDVTFISDALIRPQQADAADDIIIVVPRGQCTFERKSVAASSLYGAVGVIITDSIEARYSFDDNINRVLYPASRRDYECGNGKAIMIAQNGTLPTESPFMPALDPPRYDGAVHDSFFDMDRTQTATCPLQSRSSCPSNLCLVTTPLASSRVPSSIRDEATTDSAKYFQVCCAWDLPLTMQPDKTIANRDTLQSSSNDIVSIFMTIRQSEALYDHLGIPDFANALDSATNIPLVSMKIKARHTSAFNASMILMWMLGTAVTGVACWYAAANYRYFGDKVKYQREKRKNGYNEEEDLSDDEGEDDADNEQNMGSLARRRMERERQQQRPPSQQRPSQRKRRDHNDDKEHDKSIDEETGMSMPPSSPTASTQSSPQQRKQRHKRPTPPSDPRIPTSLSTMDDESPQKTKPPSSKRKKKKKKKPALDRFEDEMPFGSTQSISVASDDNDVSMDNQVVVNQDESVDVVVKKKKKKAKKKVKKPPSSDDEGEAAATDAPKPKSKKKKKKKPKKEEEVFELYSLPPRGSSSRNIKPESNSGSNDNNNDNNGKTGSGTAAPSQWSPQGSFELQSYHVAVFAVVASIMLMLLFFFNLYNGVTVLYGIGCAGAVSHLIFGPSIVRLVPRYLGREVSDELNREITCSLTGYDIISQGLGFIWSAVWLWYGLTHYRPSRNWFFWMTMDIFGSSFCFLVLSLLKLNSIKIATLFMVTIFFYDIFFVFITPLIFGGESVMIVVASGGRSSGDSTADDFCVKYPDDKDCTGIDFLPMLLILPRINDYLQRSVLLGLGDIVLPGFMIAFGARLDAAKRLMVDYGNKADEIHNAPTKWYEGYFVPLMIAYAIGLAFANLAVVLMERGQPALLYIVPCCLPTMFFLGRHELRDLWEGARPIMLAEKYMVKQERAWNRQRMQRQLDRWKRKKANAENQLEDEDDDGDNRRQRPSSHNREMPGHRQPRSSHNQRPDDEQHPEPRDEDICIERKAHSGTQAFRRTVRNVAKSNADTRFGPDIYKQILHRLPGRKFFHVVDGYYVDGYDANWVPMAKREMINIVAKYYEEERAKFAS